MKVIWKYAIPNLENVIAMPEGAKVLCVHTQRGEPQIWALVDPNAPKVTRTIHIHGTGHPVPDDPGTYIGTIQLACGGLVFHVFADQPA